MFSNISSFFRRYHRKLAILTLLPMFLITVTGIAIPIVDELGNEDFAEFITKVHSGNIFGSDLVYSVLAGLGLLGLLVTGVTMTGLLPRKERTLSDDAFAIGATLLLAQASAKSGETPAATTSSHSGRSVDGMEIPETSGTTKAKLTSSQAITPNTPVLLVIDIQGADGKSVTNFDRFQEKLMHLIVVSDNLQVFQHLHPSYEGSGRFEVKARFPQPGSYTLFSDYKPAGQKEQISVMKTQVPGISPPALAINRSRTKTFSNTEVSLTFPEPALGAGQETSLTFALRDKSNNQPITDLQPYLGEKGHLVIIRQTSPLTRADYIHAHAAKDTSTSRVEFMTSFPQPGRYKLWGQFNRNGKMVIADFWVNVT